MNDVEVLVVIWDRGQNRQTVVTVPVSAFLQKCWRAIASMAAAVALEIPFVEVERLARFGLRQEDKLRLVELCKAQEKGESA